ncbi:MAG: hypothetical protein KC635_22415, partial [Myxococcales bacterium]|nr:hypothetical protein [Myxococcales bacterium]
MSPSIARTLAALAVALVASAAGSARAADGKLTLAVSDFDNHAASAAYGALEKGLADMLVTDLAVADDLQLVEREKLSAVVEELKLGQSGLIDPKTAQKMGRLLGADLVLTGSIVAIEPEMRLDARIVAVETGEVLATAKAEGASSAFFEVEAALVKNLLDGLGVKLSPIQRLKVDKPATKSLPALARYGEAVAAADKGDGKGEKAALQKALQADPTFARAQERLAALEERLAALEKRTDVVERAGGLVVKPTTAADFWSNHKVHLDRREVAAALTDLQGLLGVAPASLDGLAAYVVNVTATAGKPPAAADVRKVAKGVDAGVVDALGGIAAKDAAAADAATAKLLKARKGDAVARYLRVVALTAPVNPKPTAAERSEELMHLLALADPEAQTALAAAFTAGESLATANALLAARRAYYAEKPDGWGRPRAQLLLPGVALGVKGARTLWVRIAEPNAQGVEVALPGGAVLRPTYDGSGSLDGETTAFSLKLDRKAKYPEGALAVTVRYIDGKKRDVTTKLGLWMPPLVTLGDNNWRSVQIGVPSGEDRPGSLLVDTLARVWTRPAVEDYYGADFSPSWEGLPYAWGIYGVRYRNAAETGTGFARPIALRFTDGGGSLALLGRV